MDLTNMRRQALIDFNTALARFMELNAWVPPLRRIYLPPSLASTGWYKLGVITVCVQQCAIPGRGYSWPCMAADRTIYGVLAHELGHHVHFSSPHRRAWSFGIKAIKGARVTSYEPCAEERFAETFRLFFTNPALLLAGRPQRYQFMTQIGLQPVENRPWRAVVKGAPARYISMAEKWIARGN